MLKKFTDFTNEKKETVKPVEREIVAKNPVKKPTEKDVKIPEVKEEKMPKVSEKIEHKVDFEFIGKIVKFPSQIKPSISIVMLENNNISKDKLHYIISKQTSDSLVILKYNENTEMKLTDFVNNLMAYYKKNEQLKEPFNKIVVEGTNQYSIIKNIPNISFGERKLIDVLNDDLVKLLK